MSADEDSRRYSDEEIAEILRQALQPRAGSGLPAPATEGLSLSELERVASEAGIDPARVREAALQLPAETEDQGGSPIFGPRASHVFERIVEGEIEEDRFADVIAGIRRQTRNRGNVQEYSDWVEWRSDAGEITVTVKPRNGTTHVQVMCNGGLKALGIYGPTAMATLIATVATGASLGTLPLELGALYLGGGYGVARSLWEWVGRRSAKKYQRLANRIIEDMSRLASD
jgi:hypothetical protein